MRNYVIINGVNSLTIQGLAINNLPPITKSMIRTQREEIDGRDGDIVTELGYSAYDKQMEIGLYGNFDIDEIIKYFTGEGTIVFSNEADKYYNFKILDQIDYEKLLKFKTAVVTFHCQPFKYPLEEEPVEAEITTITGTGENITLEDTEEAPMQIVYKGNTYQNGEPTPDTPIPVHVVSGDNSIEISNEDNTQSASYPINLPVKNYLDLSSQPIYSNSATNTYVEPRIEITKVNSGTTCFCLFSIGNANSLNGKNLKLTGTCLVTGTDKGMAILGYADSDGSNRVAVSSSVGLSNGQFSINMNVDGVTYSTKKVVVWLYADVAKAGNVGDTLAYENVMVSTENAQYTPYGTTPIELCKIGDYQDYIYKDSGKWYLKKEIGKVVLNGSESDWGDRPNYTYADRFVGDFLTGTEKSTGQLGYSNYFSVKSYNVNSYPYLYVNATQIGVNYSAKGTTTLAQFKTWLSTHNIEVYYVLETPTYTLIEGELLNQLEAIKMSYEGQTNISQTNNDLAFELDASVTFLTPMEINNIGNIYAKPILTIEGTGNIGVILNGIQILEIDLSNNGKITIDVPKLEAYDPDDDTLLNRLVTGDYMKLLINEGDNKITFTGEVSGATLTNYIRWI